MQIVLNMHAKIQIQNSILTDAQLKRTLNDIKLNKITLKRQATKPDRGFPLNI